MHAGTEASDVRKLQVVQFTLLLLHSKMWSMFTYDKTVYIPDLQKHFSVCNLNQELNAIDFSRR